MKTNSFNQGVLSTVIISQYLIDHRILKRLLISLKKKLYLVFKNKRPGKAVIKKSNDFAHSKLYSFFQKFVRIQVMTRP